MYSQGYAYPRLKTTGLDGSIHKTHRLNCHNPFFSITCYKVAGNHCKKWVKEAHDCIVIQTNNERAVDTTNQQRYDRARWIDKVWDIF
jgi:hypothetical protein